MYYWLSSLKAGFCPTQLCLPKRTPYLSHSRSVQFSYSVVSNSLRTHGQQHARLPCPSPTPRLAQTHVHWVGDAIQPSHPLSSPSPPFNLSQYQGLLKWISSWHQVAEVLEFQPLLTSPVPHSRKQYLGPKKLKLSWSQHKYLRNSILGIEYYYLFSPKQYLLYFLYPGMGNRKCILKIFLQYINM